MTAPKRRCRLQCPLYVLDASDDRASDLCPVDAFVELLVHQTDGADVVSAHEVESDGGFGRGLVVFGRSDDSFDGVVEDL